MMPHGDAVIDTVVDLLDVAAPPAAIDEIEALALAQFGLQARASVIGGERDRNFHLRTDDGGQFVLKVVHPAEPPDVTNLQSRLLQHIEARAPDLPVPRLRRPHDSDSLEYLWETEGQPARRVRCVTYLAGRPLHETTPSAAQRRNLGASLARIDLALADFRHPAEGHDLIWDLKTVVRVRPFLAELPDREKKELAEAALDRFTAHVAPALPQLRHQMIHNDFNPHNILVDEIATDKIAGVIDFGDAVHSPLVQDLAVAAAYQLGADGHPLQGAADLAAAFHAVYPLMPDEIDMLPEMIAARLALTIAVSSWHAVRHPENATYLLRNQSGALMGLRLLQDLPRSDAIDWLRGQIQLG